jgi:hypothetical protein
VIELTARSTGGRKMSDVLLQVAAPLLEDLSVPEDLHAYRNAIEFASTVWNVSRLSRSEHAQALEKVIKILIEGSGDPAGARNVVNLLYKRAMTMYPDETRLVAAVDVSCQGGSSVYVQAASMQP